MPSNSSTPQTALNMAVWGQAFRPFFLAAALFSVLAMAAWGLALAGMLTFSPYGGPVFWHSHEMLFGFACAVIVGFALTAVQNWTGQRATHGLPLAALFSVWLLARVLMALAPPALFWPTALIDLCFLPAAALLFARLLQRGNNHNNWILVAALLALTAANAMSHASVLLAKPALMPQGLHASAALVVLLITIVGGRVIPPFTANGTGTPPVPALAWLERATLAITASIALLYLSGLSAKLPAALLALLWTLGCACHAYRLWRWQPWVARRVPLLWSLHLAYAFVPFGMGLLALQGFGWAISTSAALHAFTVGAIGTITLAMITRVSLGHTGRALQPHALLPWAFALIALAGLARVIGGILPGGSSIYPWAAAAWCIAFAAYLFSNARALLSPRPDGRPG